MEKQMIQLQQVEQKRKMGKKLLALSALTAGTSAIAAGTPPDWVDGSNSFGDLLTVFTEWMQGNLGKLLALLGFIGTFIIYLMTHKGSVLFVGVVISLIAGGLVGIVITFFNLGNSSFDVHAAP
jgi:hypothetical protein